MPTLQQSVDASGRQLPTYSQYADWDRSDKYHNSFLIKPDEDISGALMRSTAGGLPDIAVSEAQGKFLLLLCKSIGAKRVLEIGTLGGYSTIWMAKGLPTDGYVVTHEVSAEHAAVAAENFKQAGLSSRIRIVQGPALDHLHNLPSSEPFDLAFIDADKTNNANYFKEAERLVRPGGVIIVDNVVRRGRVADESIVKDEAVEGTRELLRYIKDNKGVEATTMATVGSKGWDGFLYAVKL